MKAPAGRGAIEERFAYKMVTPMMVSFLLLGAFPIGYAFVLCFFNVRLNKPGAPAFVGLENVKRAFADPVFLGSLPKTAYFVVLVIVGSMLLGMAFALAVNAPSVRHKDVYILLGLIPWVIPRVVGGLMWRWIFDGNLGIFNYLLKAAGIIDQYQWWFNKSSATALGLCAVVEIWRNAPFVALMCFAGFQNIPKAQYESAALDGASFFQTLLHVTLPGIRVVMMSTLILLSTWALKVFDSVYIMTDGGPGTKTMISYLYIFKQAFSYLDMSYGATLGYLYTIVVAALTVFYYRVLGKKEADA